MVIVGSAGFVLGVLFRSAFVSTSISAMAALDNLAKALEKVSEAQKEVDSVKAKLQAELDLLK
jgi:hypothetical protein